MGERLASRSSVLEESRRTKDGSVRKVAFYGVKKENLTTQISDSFKAGLCLVQVLNTVKIHSGKQEGIYLTKENKPES